MSASGESGHSLRSTPIELHAKLDYRSLHGAGVTSQAPKRLSYDSTLCGRCPAGYAVCRGVDYTSITAQVSMFEGRATMKKSVAPSISALLLLSPLAYAGVVMDMVTMNASGQVTERSRIYAQSGKMRLEQVDGNETAATMIFLGNEFLYIDDREKSYIVMDEAMLDEVSTKMNEAMKKMEEQLASMPPEQRAMVEQMMKGQMQGMTAQQAPTSPAFRVEAKGSGEWKSYKCRQYAVLKGAEKVQDVCAAELDEVDGADEIIESFRNMAAYITKMTESMPTRSDEHINRGELMDEIDGFPVHTIDYENGVVTRETSLDSITEQNLDEGMFAAPEGYRRQNPFGPR